MLILPTAHRLTTYPFLHLGIVHLLFNVISLTPLLSEFESQQGSINTLILFSGPFTTIPALLYVLIESFVLRHDTSVQGASLWVFILLSARFVHMAQATPHITLITYKIPTIIIPLLLVLITAILIPHTSLLGHLLGVATGYAWGFGYLKFLVPPERALRWIEGKLNLLGRLPWYVSVDQKTFGRYGILDNGNNGNGGMGVEMSGGRRLGT
jgi:membrane associated rhomboid family serine protease